MDIKLVSQLQEATRDTLKAAQKAIIQKLKFVMYSEIPTSFTVVATSKIEWPQQLEVEGKVYDLKFGTALPALEGTYNLRPTTLDRQQLASGEK